MSSSCRGFSLPIYTCRGWCFLVAFVLTEPRTLLWLLRIRTSAHLSWQRVRIAGPRRLLVSERESRRESVFTFFLIADRWLEFLVIARIPVDISGLRGNGDVLLGCRVMMRRGETAGAPDGRSSVLRLVDVGPGSWDMAPVQPADEEPKDIRVLPLKYDDILACLCDCILGYDQLDCLALAG